jgi:Cdc6-like AAA superfamily ATPase
MDIEERIKRRTQNETQPRFITDYQLISPVAHANEPVARGPLLEQLLDFLEPAFNGSIPPNGYVYGPTGSGKTAVVSTLWDNLDQLPSGSVATIHTSTRVQTKTFPRFTYIDGRQASSTFAFYRAVLDSIAADQVPKHGIGTETLRERLTENLEGSPGLIISVDHVGESLSIDETEFIDLVRGLPTNVSWLAVSRKRPNETPLTEYTGKSISVDRYRKQILVDILMQRASDGLANQAIRHPIAADISQWADGNAHDALCVLFGAAMRVDDANRAQFADTDITAVIKNMRHSRVPLGVVFSLPKNRQSVLRELVRLGPDQRQSVSTATNAIEQSDLSESTVKRFLYELAESGIIERKESDTTHSKGRPPSKVIPRFPAEVFARLYDFQQTS